MKITLETVRTVLRQALGRNSFIASVVKRVEESEKTPTACIDRAGVLRYNPAFVDQYISSASDLFCLLLHEILHPMFGHFIYRNGPLENVGADLVINAAISILYAKPSGGGSLFVKFYRPQGMEGLLRPDSTLHDSRYGKLYATFYARSLFPKSLTTGEAITALKVLAPEEDAARVVLLGGHGGDKHGAEGNGNENLQGLSQETLGRIAEELKKTAQAPNNGGVGFGDTLYSLFLETLKSHLSIKKVLLQRFATKRKLDRFRQSIHRPAVSVSPVPLHPSKRDFVLLAAGIPPFHYHNRIQRQATQDHGLAVYLDVSGSVNEHLPGIIGILESLKNELTTVFLFSNVVTEIPLQRLLAGRLQTTYGTDFDCVADSILERNFDKAVILTDGYASLNAGKQELLKKQKVETLTILFGGKADCDEFAPFGAVLQLEDVTQ